MATWQAYSGKHAGDAASMRITREQLHAFERDDVIWVGSGSPLS